MQSTVRVSRADLDKLDDGEVVILVDESGQIAVELRPAWLNYTGPVLIKGGTEA